MFNFSEGIGRAVADDAEEAEALEAFHVSFFFIGLDLDRLEGIRGVERYLRCLSVCFEWASFEISEISEISGGGWNCNVPIEFASQRNIWQGTKDKKIAAKAVQVQTTNNLHFNDIVYLTPSLRFA